MAGTSILPSKRALDRTATVGMAGTSLYCLQKEAWRGRCLERDKIANSKSKEIVLDRCNFREDIFQRIFPDDCLEKIFEHPHIG